MIGALWCLLLVQAEARTYHVLPLSQVAKASWTHVETCGRVVYVRKQRDGDWHLTLTDGTRTLLIVEIIPAIPLPVPKKGAFVRVRGITRRDVGHGGWMEVHPAEALEIVRHCRN